jgi:Mg/Co/Ni transporter MgtE
MLTQPSSSLARTRTHTHTQLFLDVSFYMDMSPITVQPRSTVLRLYGIFRGLGLRHLVVVDTEFCVAGIVTRNELTEHAFDEAGEKVDRMYEMQKNLREGHGV